MFTQKQKLGTQLLGITAGAALGYGMFEFANGESVTNFKNVVCAQLCNVTDVNGTMFNTNNSVPPSAKPTADCISPENFTRMMVGTALVTALLFYFLYLIMLCCSDAGIENTESNNYRPRLGESTIQ